jgi:REP element-mobilizing transposase RayT
VDVDLTTFEKLSNLNKTKLKQNKNHNMAKTEHYYTKFETGCYYHVYNRTVDLKPMFKNEGNYLFFLRKYAEYLSGVIETHAYALLGNHFHLLIRVKSADDLLLFQEQQQAAKMGENLAMPQNLTTHNLMQQNLMQQNSAPQNLTPQNSAPQNSAPQNLTPQNLTPQNLTTFQKLSNLSTPNLNTPNLSTPNLNTPNLNTPNINAHDIISHQFRKFFQSYSMAFNKQHNRIGTLFQTPFKRANIDNNDYLLRMVYYIHANPQKHGLIDDFRNWRWTSYHSFLSEKATILQREEVLTWFDGLEKFKIYHAFFHLQLQDVGKYELED